MINQAAGLHSVDQRVFP